MDLSIVTGTYNRFSNLKKMVESGRRSLTQWHGFNYEFVIVDGGSRDETIEWCKAQDDIVLIEHGMLLGAVKAFNDGARASKGDYVILANDDIEFVGDSVWNAYVFMREHKNCGIGCFFQNRNNKDWHVEHMPVVLNGRQGNLPYGQVCIVPKWLGEYVGWWGNYLKTYGGDNELSAQVYELGFEVIPITNARILDRETQDELRKINNIQGAKDPRAVRGHHPDSWAWGKRWRRGNLVGPIVKEKPVIEPVNLFKYRILYLPIFEPGWAVQKQQKRGLREALAKKGDVAEFDYMGIHQSKGKQGMLDELKSLIRSFAPNIVVSQLHNGDIINNLDVLELKGMLIDAMWVNWNGDFWPQNLLSAEGIKLAQAFDLQTTINRDVLERYATMGVNAKYWQIGWEPDSINHEPDTFCDVVFLGNGYSDDRRKFVGFVKSIPGINFHLYGMSWPDNWSLGQNLYDFISACKVYRGAKISLGDSQWPNTGFVSNRVFQALVAGNSALAHQWFKGMEELGLVDGETCIIWKDFSELEKKLKYYLAHDEERKRIADKGEQLALTRHSFDARVEELWQWLNIEKEEDNDSWR